MKSWSHWTREGVFKIEPIVLGGSLHFRLWCGDTDLKVYMRPSTAARSISEGAHDQTLGFAASGLGVPASPDDWNGFR
jgi:hypothetical protein